MQDTVDPAASPPRTLAQIIGDARRRRVPHSVHQIVGGAFLPDAVQHGPRIWRRVCRSGSGASAANWPAMATARASTDAPAAASSIRPRPTAGSYRQFVAWTNRHGLVWDGVGLDIEPDARIFLQIMENPWELAPMLAGRLFDRARPARSKAAYQALVNRIRADGWQVENYQFPPIADERRAGSTVLQRLALVDVATDHEVWMLYSSFLRALGPGLIWAYGPEAAAVAVGTTGGGPDIPGSPQMPALT
jgi:hypothetical protein